MSEQDEQFDFEYWAALAEGDPQAFEQARRDVLSSVIESAPADSQRRLNGLQWQIDQARGRAETPMAACLKISGMMWDTVLGEDGLVERLEELSGRRPPKARPVREARVLPLTRPQPSDN